MDCLHSPMPSYQFSMGASLFHQFINLVTASMITGCYETLQMQILQRYTETGLTKSSLALRTIPRS